MKVCRLCGKEITGRNSVKSHILTKTSYVKQMPIETNEHLVGTSTKNSNLFNASRSGITQKGLLCRECDNRLSPNEEERERLLSCDFDFNNEPIMSLRGFDQSKIKLAFLADIFRCSISDKPLYKDININHEHCEKIKQLLNTNDPGDVDDYSVILRRYSLRNRHLIDECTFLSELFVANGINYYLIVLPRGWEVIIKIDSKPCEILSKFALCANDKVWVANAGDITKSKIFNKLLQIVNNSE